jgi:hypothetical protein
MLAQKYMLILLCVISTLLAPALVALPWQSLTAECCRDIADRLLLHQPPLLPHGRGDVSSTRPTCIDVNRETDAIIALRISHLQFVW